MTCFRFRDGTFICGHACNYESFSNDKETKIQPPKRKSFLEKFLPAWIRAAISRTRAS